MFFERYVTIIYSFTSLVFFCDVKSLFLFSGGIYWIFESESEHRNGTPGAAWYHKDNWPKCTDIANRQWVHHWAELPHRWKTQTGNELYLLTFTIRSSNFLFYQMILVPSSILLKKIYICKIMQNNPFCFNSVLSNYSNRQILIIIEHENKGSHEIEWQQPAIWLKWRKSHVIFLVGLKRVNLSYNIVRSVRHVVKMKQNRAVVEVSIFACL